MENDEIASEIWQPQRARREGALGNVDSSL
jgi:hypothetical protein